MSLASLPPTDDTLRGYLLGQLPAEEVERIGRYLEENPSAVATLAALQASDTLLDALREAPRTALPADSELAELMSRLATLDDRTISAPTSAEPESDLAALLGPPEAADELGRIAQYRVLRLLGRGGMGAVFEAEDTDLGRRVALKVMLAAIALNATAKKRFVQEAKTAAKVEHDHVVPIHQIGEFRGTPFLAMPLLAGEALDARLKVHAPLPVAETLMIGRQIAEGLAAAHASGLVHRDIKPSNIWLERHPDGAFKRVRILDFGLAKGQSAAEGELTHSGAILGTPAYMAPEQARGEKVDFRADLFSLGVVMYEMATGKRPFGGSDLFSMLTALATETPVAPFIANPAVPRALSDLIVRLLAKDVATRPQSAKDVAAELERLAAPVSPVVASPPAPRSRRSLWIAAGVLVFALAAAGAYQGKTIVRVVNNEGELVVEVEDPSVEVAVKGGAVEIRREENGRKITYLVKAGKDGEVEVRQPGSDAVLLMEQFKVARAGKIEVRVTNERLAAAKRARDPNIPATVPPSTSALDREVAEWALRGGARAVRIREGEVERLILKADDLPDMPFHVVELDYYEVRNVPNDNLGRAADLKYLRGVGFGRSSLSDVGLERIAKSRSIEELDLWSTRITPAALSHLKTAKTLRTLVLLDTQIGDQGMAAIRECKSIRKLWAQNTAVGPEGLRSIGELTELRWLSLVGEKRVPDGVAHLKSLSNLEFLTLRNTGFTDKGMAALRGFKKLAHLDVGESNVTDEGLKELESMTSLRTLVLIMSPQVTEKGVQRLGAALPMCRIEWDGPPGKQKPAVLSPDQRQALAAFFKAGAGVDTISAAGRKSHISLDTVPAEPLRVVTIDFFRNQKITAEMIALIPLFPSVEHVMLSRSASADSGFEGFGDLLDIEVFDVAITGFGDRGLARVAAAKRLRELHLSATKVTAQGLAGLRDAKSLQHLALVEVAVGDPGAKAVAGIVNLEVLNMDATGLTDDGLKHLYSLSKLKTLFIRRNPKVSKLGVDRLGAALPECKIEWDGPAKSNP